MKYALIGCGRISVNHMISAVNNNLEIVGFCDLKNENIDIAIKKSGCDLAYVKRYLDYKKMIDNEKPDLVAIATESGKHAEIALFCIKKHINVIVEKPMAMSIDDANKMIEEAKKNSVKICVCHQNRFNTAVVALKKALDEGRLGKISHASMCVRWNRGKDYYDQANWRGTWAQDGGSLMNQCIHGVDLLLYLLNDKVVSVYGQTRQQFHNYLEAEDIGMGLLTFSNGAIATIEGTVNVYPKNLEETFHIFGENGTVKIGGTSANNIEVWDFKDYKKEDDTLKNLVEVTSNVYGNGHSRLYKNMIEAIENNTEPLVSGMEGRRALEIILSIYKSELSKTIVKLPLINFGTLDMKEHF